MAQRLQLPIEGANLPRLLSFRKVRVQSLLVDYFEDPGPISRKESVNSAACPVSLFETRA
jgi:hypothetical protein